MAFRLGDFCVLLAFGGLVVAGGCVLGFGVSFAGGWGLGFSGVVLWCGWVF